MNDFVKSLLAITLLAMLGGFTVAVTDSIVSAPHREAVSASAPVMAVRVPHADSALKTDTLRDSPSIKKAQ